MQRRWYQSHHDYGNIYMIFSSNRVSDHLKIRSQLHRVTI
jgi:hypothetical protein